MNCYISMLCQLHCVMKFYYVKNISLIFDRINFYGFQKIVKFTVLEKGALW